jgi:hypothetical protein
VPRGAGTRWSARPAPAKVAAVAEDDAVPLLDTAEDEDEVDEDVEDVVADDAADEAEDKDET